MIASRRVLPGVLLLCLYVWTACAGSGHALRHGLENPLLLSGEKAFQEGRYADAAKELESFLRQEPEGPARARASLTAAQALFELKDLAPSRRYADRVLREFPGTDRALQARLLISRIEYAEGNRDMSLALLRTVIRESGDPEVTARAYLLRGRIFAENGDLELAAMQWKKSLLLTPDKGQRIAFVEEMIGIVEVSAPEATLEQIARETPREFPGDIALFALGKRALNQGRLVHASSLFRAFCERFSNHPLFWQASQYSGQGGVKDSLVRASIGSVLPLSGPLKGIGDRILKGVRLSVDRWNTLSPGDQIELVVRDCKGEPQGARTAMEDLARNPRVVAVIGPATSRAVMESAPVAQQVGLPMITPSATSEEIERQGKYVFDNAMSHAAQARTMARYAIQELGLRSFAVLHVDDAYGAELSSVFVREVGQLGGRVLCSLAYRRGTTDYGSQIRSLVRKDIEWLRMQNADRMGAGLAGVEEWTENYFPSFDAVYLPGYAEDVGLIAPQLAYYNVDHVRLLGSHQWHSVELLQRGERFVEHAIFTDGFFVHSPHTDIAQFVADFRRVYGEDPDLFSAQAYDAAEMILEALRKGGRSREDVEQALLAQGEFPGVSGLTRVLPSGVMEKDLFLIRVEDGSFRQLN